MENIPQISLFELLNDSDYDLDENTSEFIISTPIIQTDNIILIDFPCKISSNCNTQIKCKLFKITSDIFHINSINFEGSVLAEDTRDFSISNCTLKGDESVDGTLILFRCENSLIDNVTISDSKTRGLLIDNSIVTARNLTIHHLSNDLIYFKNETFLTLTNSNLHHSEENAIYLAEHSRIEISECRLTDIKKSIIGCENSYLSVNNCTFQNSEESGIEILSSNDFLIEKSTFSNVKCGISIVKNSCGVINENEITNTTENGIYCINESDLLITNNTLSNTQYPAVFIGTKSSASIQSNKISKMERNGLAIRFAQHAEIEGNEIDDVKQNGISISHTNFCSIHDNRISNCSLSTVHAYNGSSVKFEKNIIKNAGKHAFIAFACGTIQANNNEIDNVQESMAKLLFKGGGDFIDNKISNCQNQNDCQTTNSYFFKGNGNFPAISNDPERIDDSVTLDNSITEENRLCMKCNKNERVCYTLTCAHKVLCKECAEKAVKEEEECPLCGFPVESFVTGINCGDENGICGICFENKANCLLIPCGHIGACSSCLKGWFKNNNTCPFCRKDISSYAKIYDF